MSLCYRSPKKIPLKNVSQSIFGEAEVVSVFFEYAMMFLVIRHCLKYLTEFPSFVYSMLSIRTNNLLCLMTQPLHSGVLLWYLRDEVLLLSS